MFVTEGQLFYQFVALAVVLYDIRIRFMKDDNFIVGFSCYDKE
jgi:hypothetical protein